MHVVTGLQKLFKAKKSIHKGGRTCKRGMGRREDKWYKGRGVRGVSRGQMGV